MRAYACMYDIYIYIGYVIRYIINAGFVEYTWVGLALARFKLPSAGQIVHKSGLREKYLQHRDVVSYFLMFVFPENIPPKSQCSVASVP